MKYYSYHPVNKIFVSEGIADESPLEPGVFLYPANSTNVEIIEFEEDEFIVFNEENQTWEKVREEKVDDLIEEANNNHFKEFDLEEYNQILDNKKNVLRKLGVSEEDLEIFFQ